MNEPLALNQKEAARMLGVSVNYFRNHVRPRVKCVYIGDVRRWRVAELERYLKEREG